MIVEGVSSYMEDTNDCLVKDKSRGILRIYCGCGDYKYSRLDTVNTDAETRYKYRCRCGNLIDIVARRKV